MDESDVRMIQVVIRIPNKAIPIFDIEVAYNSPADFIQNFPTEIPEILEAARKGVEGGHR